MWYFVEKNGRCISKHKVLVSAKLRKMQEVKSGVDPESLKITDNKGLIYKWFDYDTKGNEIKSRYRLVLGLWMVGGGFSLFV